MGGYDALKTEYLHINHQKRVQDSRNSQIVLNMYERFAIAQFVSIIAGVICYPIDSVKRRFMMQAGQPKHQRRYQNSIHAFRLIFEKEGIRGFYLGLGPNILRSIGGAGLLVSYDIVKLSLNPQ